MSKSEIKSGIETQKDRIALEEVSFAKDTKKKIVPSGFDKEKPASMLRILVVDDYDSVGNLLCEYLSWCGHDVKVVDNGAEAVGLCMNENFDLALVDLIMPNVTGHDVIKALNSLDKRPKTGLITGWSEKFELEEGLSVDFIVRKPFDLSTIASSIDGIFGGDFLKKR